MPFVIKGLQLFLDLFFDLNKVHAHAAALSVMLLILGDLAPLYLSDLLNLLEVDLLRLTEIRDINALSLPLDLDRWWDLALGRLLVIMGPTVSLVVSFLFVDETD